MVFSFDVLLSRLQEAKVLKKMRIEDISKKSNVPVGTISKIFAGIKLNFLMAEHAHHQLKQNQYQELIL